MRLIRVVSSSSAERPLADEVAWQRAGVARAVGEAAAGFNGPFGAPATDLLSALNNIDFRKMIGGRLHAAVDAQLAPALVTVDFINKVGFSTDDQGKPELVLVNFSHKRHEGKDQDGNEIVKNIERRVPLLGC